MMRNNIMNEEMTREKIIDGLEIYTVGRLKKDKVHITVEELQKFIDAIKALEQEPIDKSAMMCEIYMEGVNMTGEYQGCWVRFKNIEKIVDKYIAESE